MSCKEHKKKYVDIVEYASRGMLQRVKSLIASGCDVDEQDEYGNTAVLRAAQRNDVEMMSVLIDAGASVSTKRGDGMNALAIARFNGSNAMLQMIENSSICLK